MIAATDQFSDAMRHRGLIPPTLLIADGKIHRCDVKGKGGENDGAYIFHADGIPAGGFQNHKDGKGWENWRADIGRQLTPIEEAEYKKKIEAIRRIREAEAAKRNAEGQTKAKAILSAAKPAMCDHPYAARKKIDVYHGVMCGAWLQRQIIDGCLLIPMYYSDGVVWSVQAIFPKKININGKERDKDFLYGARKSGLFFPIGQLDGATVILIGEGYATMMTCYMATGLPAVAAFDAGNLKAVARDLRQKYPSLRIIICADDDWKEADNPGITKAQEASRAIDGLLAVPAFESDRPDKATDFNDMAELYGMETVKRLITSVEESGHAGYRTAPAAEPAKVGNNSSKWLKIGSDVEIAGRIREDLERKFSEIIHAEGECWRYKQTHWEPIPDHELRLATHVYDGADFITAAEQPSRVKLNKSHVDSIINEMKALITINDFFAQNKIIGINCASGFIRFAVDGTPSLEAYDRNHGCRHTLLGHWHEAVPIPPEDSMLHRLLSGIFLGDEDAGQKTALLAEVCGSAALGYATKLQQPRAIVLKGAKAENGKSQVLDLARSVLPASAKCTVPPADMGDDRHIVGLVGKLLNATDELSSSKDISSDTFKTIITGETVKGRDVYKSRVEFRPVAQHIFATNTLPEFAGGMDRGVQRRLLPILFNRVIPVSERVENIGRRIGEEEADLLLAWTVAGASRLIRQRGFTMPPSSKTVLNEWIFGADMVLAWASEKVMPGDVFIHKIRTRDAYTVFRSWALADGYDKFKIPAINTFVQRITSNVTGVEYRRTREGGYFLGMIITA